ncbi:MAG: right-handed parallel beta-helix repeat-containing protein [Candidatus Hydrogenedentes bacterium]|nr:right-handed parallel beta-helix repeat-containing protein [Candidatus Hydrogenedentota bacterium]
MSHYRCAGIGFLFLFVIFIALQAQADTASILQPNPQAVAEVEAGTCTTASAAWWGFDPGDATDCLQNAIDSKAAKLIVPYMGSPWIIRPVTLRSNLEIYFEPGVKIHAKKEAFKGKGDSLFSAVNCEHIILTGYGAQLRMNKADYQSSDYEKAEWRMCLDFMGCSHIRIEGLALENSGGDGIYLGATEKQPWCAAVTIRDVLCRNHHRQGISVISAVDLLIENCAFTGTQGTAPEAGIDLEPNNANEKMTNVIVRNCTMANNDGAGILVYLKHMRKTTEPVSILFENCHIRSGRDQGIAVGAIGDDGPDGWIEFRNCTVENTQSGGTFVYDKSATAAEVRFVNCKWNNVVPEDKQGTPLLITLMRESITKKHGGIVFEECVVFDPCDRPVLKTEEDQGEKGALDIRGRILRRGPGEARSNISPESTGCTLKVIPL